MHPHDARSTLRTRTCKLCEHWCQSRCHLCFAVAALLDLALIVCCLSFLPAVALIIMRTSIMRTSTAYTACCDDQYFTDARLRAHPSSSLQRPSLHAAVLLSAQTAEEDMSSLSSFFDPSRFLLNKRQAVLRITKANKPF